MSILDVIIVILLLSWLGGYGFHIAGDLIHILLVIAIIVLIARLISGRKVV